MGTWLTNILTPCDLPGTLDWNVHWQFTPWALSACATSCALTHFHGIILHGISAVVVKVEPVKNGALRALGPTDHSVFPVLPRRHEVNESYDVVVESEKCWCSLKQSYVWGWMHSIQQKEFKKQLEKLLKYIHVARVAQLVEWALIYAPLGPFHQCFHGLSAGTLVSSHSPETCTLDVLMILNWSQGMSVSMCAYLSSSGPAVD